MSPARQHKPVNAKARSKAHSGVAATFVVILGNIPWYMYTDPESLQAWAPFFSAPEFVALATVGMTWVISELDYLFRR